MKFTLPLFVALVTAAPAFSLQKLNAPHKLKAPQKLKEPLTMITVTDWEEGIVSGRHINESPGEIDVDGKTFHQMKKYPIETHVGESIRFKVERKDLWDDHFVIVGLILFSCILEANCYSAQRRCLKILGLQPFTLFLKGRVRTFIGSINMAMRSC
jgi:hypothetical protein